MTPQEKAAKEVEVFDWLKKQGYDRRASKDIAPIIVRYLEKEVNKNFVLAGVSDSLPTDAEIRHHWKRQNCFGHYAEGLEHGAIWMRDNLVGNDH